MATPARKRATYDDLIALPEHVVGEIVGGELVVSPGTVRFDRREKLPVYARAQVRHAWLVDPIAKTLEVYRLEGGGWLLLGAFGNADLVRAEPFEATGAQAQLELGALWA
jgi:hypothetical protein